MQIEIDVRMRYAMPPATALLIQVEAAQTAGQEIVSAQIDTGNCSHFARIGAEDGIGERIWLRAADDFKFSYRALVEINRQNFDISRLNAVEPHLLPGETVKYLLPSRFCPSDNFHNFVTSEFGGLEGGPLIAAFATWISEKFTYQPGSSGTHTTAQDSFVQRQGVCRDYAHVLITLARTATIPARFASVYAPNVTPLDFHAVAEVYLDGAWYLVDPTGMAGPTDIATIGVGQDAASVAFMTSYGPATFVSQQVNVTSVAP